MRATCMLGGWARRARDDGSGWLKAHSAVPGGNRQARLPARPRASHPRHLTATRAGRQSRERDASAPGPVSRELGVAEEIEVAEAPNSLRCYARGCPAVGDRPVSVGAGREDDDRPRGHLATPIASPAPSRATLRLPAKRGRIRMYRGQPDSSLPLPSPIPSWYLRLVRYRKWHQSPCSLSMMLAR